MIPVNLNDESLLNYGDGTPLLPWGDGKYRARVVLFRAHDGYKGFAYRATVEILESNRDDVAVGYKYVKHFGVTQPGEKGNAAKKELRAFLAACFGADPRDKTFDANARGAELCALGESLAEADIVLDIEGRNRETEKGKFTNYSYSLAK